MDMKRRNEKIEKLDKLSDIVSAYQKRIQTVKKSLENNVKVKDRTIKKLYEWRPHLETEVNFPDLPLGHLVSNSEMNEVIDKGKDNLSEKENESSELSIKNEKNDQLLKNNVMDLKSPDKDEEAAHEESDTDSSETLSLDEKQERKSIERSVGSVTMWEERNSSNTRRNDAHHRDSSERRYDHQRNYYRRNFRFRNHRVDHGNDSNYNFDRNHNRFEERNFYRSRNDDVFDFLQQSEEFFKIK
jgi:hypothetical protein